LELIKGDIEKMVKNSFLEGAPIIPVSSVTGEGIPELKRQLTELLKTIEPKPDRGIFRMPIDRCFTMKGFGTVVAGTVISGSVKTGDSVELLPQKRIARIRGIQIHNQNVTMAGLGARAALNLIGMEKEEIVRGNVLASVGYYEPTSFINATLYLLAQSSAATGLKNMTRVRLHLGTAEIMARVLLLDKKELLPGEEGLVQLRLETPTVCDWNDRFVIRTYSPAHTIGGGVVLQRNPIKAKRFDSELLRRLSILRSGDPSSIMEQHLLQSGFVAKTIETLAKETTLTLTDAQVVIEKLIQIGKVRLFNYEGKNLFIATDSYAQLNVMILDKLKEFHKNNPLQLNCRKAELLQSLLGGQVQPTSIALFNEVVAQLEKAGKVICKEDKIRLATHNIKFSPQDQALCEQIEQIYLNSNFATPKIDELKNFLPHQPIPKIEQLTRALIDIEKLVEIGEGIILHTSNLKSAEEKLRQFFTSNDKLTASEFRQLLATTRKYVIPLLNYFDKKGITLRRGEVRILKDRKE